MSPPQENIPLVDLIKLTGKVAIVTGGAMGIGFAISYRLAEAGATIAIADTNEERAQQASQELKHYGYRNHLTCFVCS